MSAGQTLRRAARLLTTLPARILISAALLALVATQIDWGAVGDTLADASWGWFAAGVVLAFAALVIGAVRWHAFLASGGPATPLGATLRAYGIGAFSNNLLPTGFGGDVVRAMVVAPPGPLLARALASVAADRFSALMCGLLLAWAAALIEPGEVPGSFLVLLAIATGAGLGALVFGAFVLRRRGLSRYLPGIVRPWAGEAAAALRAYDHDRRLQARVVAFGLVFQALMVAASWSLSEALGLGLGPGLLAVVTPLVLIATLLPISIAGFGVREGSYVALLGEVGVSAGDATLLSLLSAAALALASVPGGLAVIAGGRRPGGDIPVA